MRFPEAFDGSFGEVHFAQAPIEPRRRRRLIRVADQILQHPDGTLPHKIPDPHQLDAAYRLFAADEVTHAAVLHTHTRLTQRRILEQTPVVLVAHDDTLLDFSGLDVELGPIGNGGGSGFVCHSSLALTPQRDVIGLAHQTLYCHPPGGRPRQRPGPAGRLWRDGLEAIERLGPIPDEGPQTIHLMDRAGDITEVLDYADERDLHYIVRSQHNRYCEAENEVERLHDSAETWPAMGELREVKVHSQKGVPARTAKSHVTYREVTLQPPVHHRGRERGEALRIGVVRVWEPNPPEGVEALDWLLLTDLELSSAEEAWTCVEYYACRMVVEEYHKCLKSGVSIERLQLTTRERLEAAIGLLSVVGLILLVWRDAARSEETAKRPASSYVPPLWVALLSKHRHGRIRSEWTMREFLMALARLGGHQNRPSDGLPGWITLWRGWERLSDMIRGAQLAGQADSS